MYEISEDFIDAAKHLSCFGDLIFQGWYGSKRTEDNVRMYYAYLCENFLDMLIENATKKED